MEKGSIKPETFTYIPPRRFFVLVNGVKKPVSYNDIVQKQDGRKKTLGIKRWYETNRDLPGIPA